LTGFIVSVSAPIIKRNLNKQHESEDVQDVEDQLIFSCPKLAEGTHLAIIKWRYKQIDVAFITKNTRHSTSQSFS